MPFTVITAAAGEWIFGRTDEQRDGMCAFTAFMIIHLASLFVSTLTLISFDRCMFIVKPLCYKQHMKPWVAFLLVVITWVLTVAMFAAPLFDVGGQYGVFSGLSATCGLLVTDFFYSTIVILMIFILVIVITVTTLWAFCTTCNFVRSRSQRSIWAQPKERQEEENRVYQKKVCNLVGIFGLLLTLTVITLLPYVILLFIISNKTSVPPVIHAANVPAFFFYMIGSSWIQLYFRQDLRNTITKGFSKIQCSCKNDAYV